MVCAALRMPPHQTYALLLCCSSAPACHCTGFKISQEQLKSDPELLGAVLNYHIVPDRALNESQVGGGRRGGGAGGAAPPGGAGVGENVGVVCSRGCSGTRFAGDHNAPQKLL